MPIAVWKDSEIDDWPPPFDEFDDLLTMLTDLVCFVCE